MRETPDTSAESAARARRAYAENRPVRAALRRGDVTIAEVMREQPRGLADRTLFEVLLMAHRVGRARLRAINSRALEDQVNLGLTLGCADERTREWVALNALPHARSEPGDVWAQLMAD